ncbi:phosphoribosyltransferase-like protein [Pedobacter sp.]|uniref:phosphoribosyltransferase-like protein n=1 Tax=Pedobacter sp. TaxID=1411316 RepID=UPI002CF1AF83|nr:hypothetical protein [Pedobacter sp.]HWW40042.1 hypothetical protein [Pedobacter sp.]
MMETENYTFIKIIKALNESVWEGKVKQPLIDEWLNNFSEDTLDVDAQRTHALFLLSNFMYFGINEIRELLKALFRDLYRYPIVEKIRKENEHTIDLNIIEENFKLELKYTRFIGLGNPSESGSHLLYYFRQENGLPSDLFIHQHEIIELMSVGNEKKEQLTDKCKNIKRYVFLDDLCGSGTQVKMYIEDLAKSIRVLNPNVELHYFVLFGSTDKLQKINELLPDVFDTTKAVMEYDQSFKCFDDQSRFFLTSQVTVDKSFAKRMCKFYGEKLYSDFPLGFKNSQLLLGFFHNTPNNTLPIFWSEGIDGFGWQPTFRRYPKYYE